MLHQDNVYRHTRWYMNACSNPAASHLFVLFSYQRSSDEFRRQHNDPSFRYQACSSRMRMLKLLPMKRSSWSHTLRRRTSRVTRARRGRLPPCSGDLWKDYELMSIQATRSSVVHSWSPLKQEDPYYISGLRILWLAINVSPSTPSSFCVSHFRNCDSWCSDSGVK